MNGRRTADGRRARPAIGWVIRAVLTIPLLMAAVMSAKLLLSDLHYEAGQPDRAVVSYPWHRFALEAVVEGADEAGALAAAEQSLSTQHFAGAAARKLGLASAAAGDEALAAKRFELATRLDSRDRIARAWLLEYAVQQGRYDVAYEHMDVLLRLSPGASTALFPFAIATLRSQAAIDAFIERLRETPPWRAGFISSWPNEPAWLPLLAALLDPLRAGPGALNTVERDLWVDRLTDAGQSAKAYFVWVEGLPPADRAVIGNVHDGSFERPFGERAFGWRVPRSDGALVRATARMARAGERGLEVGFRHRRVAPDLIRQRLALPPGRHQLTGQVRLDDLRNPRGLVWLLACANGTQIAQSEPLRGTAPWQTFSIGFSIPESGCDNQWLTLRLDSRIDAERFASGRAGFDDLLITRLPTPSQP